MRQGFLIGAIILWIAINILGNIADMQPLLGQVDNSRSGQGLTQAEALNFLSQPEITDQSFFSAVISTINKIGSFVGLLGRSFILWHPALWQGDAIYIYYFFLAIGVSFWVVLVLSLRGTGSG
jgi:hypothetical protein